MTRIQNGEELYIPEDIKVAVLNILYNSIQKGSGYYASRQMPITAGDDLDPLQELHDNASTFIIPSVDTLQPPKPRPKPSKPERQASQSAPFVIPMSSEYAAPRGEMVEEPIKADDLEMMLYAQARGQRPRKWVYRAPVTCSPMPRPEFAPFAAMEVPDPRRVPASRLPPGYYAKYRQDYNPFQDPRAGSNPPAGARVVSRTNKPMMIPSDVPYSQPRYPGYAPAAMDRQRQGRFGVSAREEMENERRGMENERRGMEESEMRGPQRRSYEPARRAATPEQLFVDASGRTVRRVVVTKDQLLVDANGRATRGPFIVDIPVNGNTPAFSVIDAYPPPDRQERQERPERQEYQDRYERQDRQDRQDRQERQNRQERQERPMNRRHEMPMNEQRAPNKERSPNPRNRNRERRTNRTPPENRKGKETPQPVVVAPQAMMGVNGVPLPLPIAIPRDMNADGSARLVMHSAQPFQAVQPLKGVMPIQPVMPAFQPVQPVPSVQPVQPVKGVVPVVQPAASFQPPKNVQPVNAVMAPPYALNGMPVHPNGLYPVFVNQPAPQRTKDLKTSVNAKPFIPAFLRSVHCGFT